VRIRQATPPYLLPAPETVSAGPWILGGAEPLPERLVDWDPATELEVFREVELDADRLVAEGGLGPDARVRLLPMVRSDLTGLRIVGAAADLDLAFAGDGPHPISLRVGGGELGGTVTISTRLVWLSGSNPSSLGPTRPGSELWGDEARCVLEGEGARFPVSAVSFASLMTLDPAAAWTLDWEPSRLEDPVLGAVRLLVNTDHARVRESVVSGSQEPGADVVRALVHFDVARTLITTALRDEAFVETADSYPEGSVGRTIADLLRAHWDETPTALASRLRNFPRQFAMELQARFHPVPDG
jgi:hypothetical protein